MTKQTRKPLMLTILDGWGLPNGKKGDTFKIAKTPNFYQIAEKSLYTTLIPSGERVGLPAGQMGNSEVGHLNIGAGRVVYQDLTRITKSIKDGDFFQNEELIKVMDKVKEHNSNLHVMGLLSDGGVHSHITHLFAVLKMAKERGLENVYVHCFLDGRDVAPDSGIDYVKRLENYMEELGIGKISTVIGRFYAMDRDKRFDRVQAAYECMTEGKGNTAHSGHEAVENSYKEDVLDEFVKPCFVEGGKVIGENDGLVFINFRADRAREITRAFVDEELEGFVRNVKPNVYFCCMTQYDITINAPIAFPQEEIVNTLGEVLAKNDLKQLRIAETEKYAHVTFFFNGGVEEVNPNEDRILIPSPKVATYDLQPEMSANEVCDAVCKEIKENNYDVIILNFANPDMVGHTGIMEAAKIAVETVDTCLGKIYDCIMEKDGTLLVTADHGNVEQMLDDEGNVVTSHTNLPVPFILANKHLTNESLRAGGALEDIAPTMLDVLGIEKPKEMTGVSLIVR